jgi:hypothetical protein
MKGVKMDLFPFFNDHFLLFILFVLLAGIFLAGCVWRMSRGPQ